MVADFVHLHVHSQYSILDGQASISALVDKAIKNGMKGIALTDHGNMFGVKEFFNYVSKKNGEKKDQIKAIEKQIKAIQDTNQDSTTNDLKEQKKAIEETLFKPIIGCEMYVARDGMGNKRGKHDQSGHHLVVLAKNNIGYHNLIKLVSKGWTDGFYSRPRTDKAELEKHSEGLIISTACLGGEISQHILKNDLVAAEEAILWYKRVFGEDYYLELQRHKATVSHANHEAFELQQRVNLQLIEFSNRLGVKILCTNDVHFVEEEDAEAHDRLICLSTGKDLDDPNRMLYSKQEWMKSREEMGAVFADVPEAIANTMEVYDKIEFYSINHDPILPDFPLPAPFTDENEYLHHLTYQGAIKRWGSVSDEQKERLDFELQTIKKMGYPGYFLIVQDFIQAARDMGVAVGPGRGSAAGSAVAYCLKITQIDPIQYDLLFERFLNPDRISLPDIDIDFDDDGRGQVLRWVTEKYGFSKVAHIITYGTMATKSAIKDVARVHKLPLRESERLTKLVPDKIPDKAINLINSIEYVPELRLAANSTDPLLRDTLKYARMLEGNVRNTGVHACGIIIGRDDITDWVPVSTADDKESGEKMLVTQYEGSVIEDTGLIKMDFLGLKTLSIIKEAIVNIKQTQGIEIDIDTISLFDEKTYQLYSDGRTTGTFQFESAGMQKYLRELQPTCFEDLIAMNALYRPGPMGYIPSFIARKHGREEIKYDIQVTEQYLKETYGITVYQEQVMLLSRLLAGFTRGQSDSLRKAMGKKDIAKINELSDAFLQGGKANGHNEQALKKTWTDWEEFAKYAFNKSHATCYSLIAYQTAYLKANYPAEYMAAVMSRSISNTADVMKYMDECKAMKIRVLGPDVNESLFKFSVNKEGNIRFGLGAIKGVGAAAVQSIVEEREKNGNYQTIFDFVERVNLFSCNKKSIESIALVGGFEAFPTVKREHFVTPNDKGETLNEILCRYGTKFQADANLATNSLFGDDNRIEVTRPEIPPIQLWGNLERLTKEKEMIGIYLSAHPLDEFGLILKYVCNTTMSEVLEKTELQNRELIFGGIVTAIREGTTGNGKPFGFVRIEDYSGSNELAFWGNEWIEWSRYMRLNAFLFLKGKYQSRPYKPEELDLKITSIELLTDVKERVIEKIAIELPLEELTDQLVSILKAFLMNKPGKVALYFRVFDLEEGKAIDLVSKSYKVSVEKELISFLEENPKIKFKIN